MTLLNPDTRSLYISALTPPPGYQLDQALGAAYTLDPNTLLSVPVHLALMGREGGRDLSRDPIVLLEALRRLSDRITVYAERGRMHVPAKPHLLYGLLENIVVETRVRSDGIFHPKFWLLRFTPRGGPDIPGDPGKPLVRLLVLSRNLELSRAWDLVLQLEGTPGEEPLPENAKLAEFIRSLPDLAAKEVSASRRSQAAALAGDLWRTAWELPEGFDQIRFHVLGPGNPAGWRPPRSWHLAVISPFIDTDALRMLAAGTKSLEAVISRPEMLDELPEADRGLAKRWLVLDEAAESEDGAETAERDTIGLHAKAYIAQTGWYTHVVLGSANATSSALRLSRNEEILVELVGKTSRVKGVMDLLGADSLGAFLHDHPPQESPAVDEAEKQAEDALDLARRSIAGSSLLLQCAPDGDAWRLTLEAFPSLFLRGLRSIRVWLLTLGPDRALDGAELGRAGRLDLGRMGAASITGLVAFELTAEAAPLSKRFALSLPVEGLPPERDAAIMRMIIQNRDGFLRYLMLLLGTGEEAAWMDEAQESGGRFVFSQGSAWLPGGALLEELVRAFSRDRDRLSEVARVVSTLQVNEADEPIIPPEFLELWQVFLAAMAEESK